MIFSHLLMIIIRSTRWFMLILIICLFAGIGSLNASTLDKKDRTEIEKIIREYLLANPELIVEVQQALQAKQRKNQKRLQDKALLEKSNIIFNSQYQSSIGNPMRPSLL